MTKIKIKQKSSECLGDCVFKCTDPQRQSLFDCKGPIEIGLYIDTDIGELGHIYIHYQKHILRSRSITVDYVNGEEGLCELLSFYTGCYITNRPKPNKFTDLMLYGSLPKTANSHIQHNYTSYVEYFRTTIREFQKSKITLAEFIDSAIANKGLTSLDFDKIVYQNRLSKSREHDY